MSQSQSIISERGRLGLPNVGNSCYLNSTIQCLAGTQELLKYFSQIVILPNEQSIKKYKAHQLTSKTIKMCDDFHKIAESNKIYMQFRN